jgi:hypothetical protein
MTKRKLKSALLTSIALAIVACTNSVPNNTQISNQENFQDLNKEYTFKTKELTQSYLKRKLNKWLDVSGTPPSPDGPKLVKEIAYAGHKYRDLFCAIVAEDNSILDDINAVQAVQERKDVDIPFSDFLKSCIDLPPAFTGEFRVNTYTSNSQGSASVAMDSNGDFVITWTDYGDHDGNGSGIFAQRYSSTGTLAGAEFQVNTFTTDTQQYPSVAIDNDGDFVITWDSIQDGSAYGIYAQRYNSNGTKAGSEFQVNNFTSDSQYYPAAAMDSNGDFVITWTSYGNQDGNGGGIFARRYDSAGTPAGSEFQVNTYITGTQVYPSVAMDNAGDFVITWTDYGNHDGDYHGIFAQRYDSTGAQAGTEFQVNTYNTGAQFNNSVAMDNNGNFVVTWNSYQDGNGDGVMAQRYDSNGINVISANCSFPRCNTETGEFLVNTSTTGYQDINSVAMDSNGDFVVTWVNYEQIGNVNNPISAQRYDSTGSPAGSEFTVNTFSTDRKWSPAVAIDSLGNFIITWQSKSQDGSAYGVYAQRYNSGGIAQ